MKINTFIEKVFIIDTINNKKISFVYNKILGTIMILFFFSILLVNLFALNQIKKFFEGNPSTFTVFGIISICLESIILTLHLIKNKLMNTKSMKLQGFIKTVIDIQVVLIYYYNMFRFWIISPLKMLFLSVYIASPNLRSKLFSSVISKYLFDFFVFMETLLSVLITLNLIAVEKPIDPNISTFFTKLSCVFEETLYICVFACCGINAIELAEMFENVESVRLTLFFLKFVAFFVMNIAYFSELPYFEKYTENLIGVVLPFSALTFFVLGLLRGNVSFTAMIILFLGPFVVFTSLFYIKNIYKKNVVYLMTNKLNVAIKKIFLKKKSHDIRKLVKIDVGVYRSSKVRKNWSKKIRRMKGYENEEEFGIEKEMDMFLLKKFNDKHKNNNYGKYLTIIWMLENDMSISRLLRTLSEMMNASSKTLYSRYLYQSAKHKVQAEFERMYWKSRKSVAEERIRKKKKMKFLKLEEELEELNKIDVDLAYAFRYKREVTNLTKLINTYVGINKQFVSMLKAQSKCLKDLHELSSKLYVTHQKIVKCFHFLHDFSRETEIIHLGPFFIYLIKCANLHRRASEIIKIYKKRIINSKNLVDNNSIFTDNNLFKDTVILKAESSGKGFGTILDIYGNLRLLKCKGLTERNFIGKHFNCLIPESHQKPHHDACKASLESAKTSSLGRDKFVFIKIPNSDKILPANLKVKIIPFAKYNFKFVIGVKFLRQDSNMYMILGEENKVEAYSYNMKYQFEGNDKYLVTGVKISDLSQKIGDKLEKLDKNEELGDSDDSKDIEDLSFLVENSVDVRSNTVNRDYSILMNKKKEFRAELVFQDKSGFEKVKKNFFVEIIKKTYLDTNYSYHILVLRNDSQNTKKHKERKTKTDTRKDGNSSKFSSQRMVNRVEDSHFESEDETHNLLGLEIRNPDQHGSSEYKTDHEQKEEDAIIESHLDIRNQQELEESDFEDEDDSVQNFNFEKAKIGTGSVFSTVGGIQNHKKFIAFEDALSKKPGLFKIILMLLCYFFCLAITSYSNHSLGTGLDSVSQQFKLFNELSTVVYEHQFEIQMFYSKLLTGVAYESGITEKDRYSKYDLKIEKAPMIPESDDIVTSSTGTTGNSNTGGSQNTATTGTTTGGNEATTTGGGGTNPGTRIIQEETSSSTNTEKILNSNPYLNLNTTVDMEDIESYLKYQWEVSRENIFRLSEKISYYVGLLGDENQRLFEHKVKYSQHEINGTSTYVEVSIFQGYLLLTTAKLAKISRFSTKQLRISNKNRDILYFRDNTLTGFLVALNSFLGDLYKTQQNIYSSFSNSILQLTLYTGVMLTICFLITLYSVFSLRNMAFEIYESFTKLVEGEFEERFDQLNQVSEMMLRFQESCYFTNLISKNMIESGQHLNNSKNAKRYLDKSYCFGMIVPFLTIALFYIFQIGISARNALTFQKDVDVGVSIGKKQNDLMISLKDQILLYTILKQRLTLGADSFVEGKKIDEYTQIFLKNMEDNSRKIVGIFEDDQYGGYFDELVNHLREHSNSSLCSFTPQFEERKELCTSLDRKIPDKGLIQVYFRNYHYLQEMYSQINRTENFDPKSILNDEEFIEFELTFENLYYWSWLFFCTDIDKYFQNYFSNDIKSSVNLTIGIMIGFVFLSFGLIMVGFLRINEQVKRVVFSYRLISLNSVINSTGVRIKFLKVFQLNQKHF